MVDVVVKNQIEYIRSKKKVKAYKRAHRRPGGPYKPDDELFIFTPTVKRVLRNLDHNV